MQITPGDLFDRLRVVSQPTDLLPQPGVFGADAPELAGEREVLVPGLEHRRQSACADEGVERQCACDESQGELQEPRAERHRSSHLGLRCSRGLGLHWGIEVMIRAIEIVRYVVSHFWRK